MIKPEKTPIEKGKADALASWLLKEEAQTLIRVVEARANLCTVNASNKVLESGNHPNYVGAAESELKSAHRYENFLSVLEEIRNAEDLFILQLNPTHSVKLTK